MDEEQRVALQSRNPEKIRSVLKKFNVENATVFDFSIFNSSDQWLEIWKSVFNHLRNQEMKSVYVICLNTIRLLTRDKFSIQHNNITEDFNHLLYLAGLGEDSIPIEELVAESYTDTIIEALKCLCNIVFQSGECRQLCAQNSCCNRILRRVTTTDSSDSYEICLFDLKLLFLITALEPDALRKVERELNGHLYLTHLLDRNIEEDAYSSNQIELLCENLKVLFNITSSAVDGILHEGEIQKRHLISVLRKLILRFGDLDSEKEMNVIMHAVNLLTNMTGPSLSELIVKCDPNTKESSKMLLAYEGYNIRALDILIRYLRMLLKKPDDERSSSSPSNQENLPSLLTVLVKAARCNHTIRHFIRAEILPPLKDVSLPPEQGNELRNHLCRFLTVPEMVLRNLAAELLFVCCKENVGRMIKYTGYGNAAGLFAQRGLMDCRTVRNADYSSDSEDSDTEEYRRVQPHVNPVIGCYEAMRPDPFEGMSEERKEYEVMQLVDLMDKLQKSRVVQPCRVGEDGKPQPVEHILELQEELPKQQVEKDLSS